MYDLSNPLHPANIVLAEVKSQLGKGFYWQREVTGVSTDWCAATVVAAGIYTNLSGKVFPSKGQQAVYYAGMCGKAFEAYGGRRIDGPFWGGQNVRPCRGDIIIFVWKRGNEDFYYKVKRGDGEFGRYSASHIGFVTDCKGDTVYTIEGNCNGYDDKSRNVIKERSYNINYECISFYVRPDWSRAEGVVAVTSATAGTYIPNEDPTVSTQLINGVYSTQLYTTESTKADASIREVAYFGSDGKPTISMTGVRLAVVNYTGLLSSLNKLTASGSSVQQQQLVEDEIKDNLDKLQSIPRTIVSYLKQKGYNTAASIGIIANIQEESNYKTDALGTYVKGVATSFGLCQWPNERGRKMMSFVGKDWKNSLSGQLTFMLYEFETSYTSLDSELKSVPNTLEGTKRAADRFLRLFENKNLDAISAKRQEVAESLWKKVVAGSASASADYSDTPGVQQVHTNPKMYLTWPLPDKPIGVYSSPFGYRGNIGINGASPYHSGVDIDDDNGMPIHCCGNGTVYRSYWNDARGWVIIINHGSSVYTLYQHMKSKSSIDVGTEVTANQVIGYVGNTGVGNNHLHLEVHIGKTLGMAGVEYYDNYYQCWRNHYAVNPAQFFPSAKG